MNVLSKLTKNYLKLNKKRTIVTIIGIILAGAMISAVTTLAVSFQSFLITVEKADRGNWEANFKEVTYSDVKYIKNNPKFKDIAIMKSYAMAESNFSEEPFIEIKSYDQKALEQMGINLISGRLPENENEIIISQAALDGKSNQPKVGDTIILPVGEMTEKGFEVTENKNVTITGIMKKPWFEKEATTSAITKLIDESVIAPEEKVAVGVVAVHPKTIYEDTKKVGDELKLYELIENKEQQEKKYNIEYNEGVLMYMGIHDDAGFNEMLYRVCGILVVVIAIVAILVIYNSFAISVSERKKQFGMLSSVGATKKQIRHSVLYEGALLGAIGIPLGILFGIIGIGITLKFVNQLLKPMILSEGAGNWDLELIISWPAILIAVILIMITIFLSVIMPARKASKISPIEAIRQTSDTKMKAKKLKTPKFITKLFGIEGQIALKNLKRSKKRYRTTVLSLIISIILFITASGFVGYLFEGFDVMYTTVDYDYQVYLQTGNYNERVEEALKQIEEMPHVEKRTTRRDYQSDTYLKEEQLHKEFKEALSNNQVIREYHEKTQNGYRTKINVISLDDKQYEAYRNQLGIPELKDNQIILVNYVNNMQIVKAEYHLSKYKQGDKMTIQTRGEERKKKEFEIVKITDEVPYGQERSYLGFLAITTKEGQKQLASLENPMYLSGSAIIKAQEGQKEKVKEKLKQLKEEYEDVKFNMVDIAKTNQSNRNLKTVIQIFLYGFIVLISAIGISNIFNTISTNINLRRREFANLKSCGMTDKGFKKMLDLECFFYGTKALLYGIPIGTIICYFLNKAFSSGVNFIFNMPWASFGICLIAVYCIVFATMIYSSRKVKKENIIDVLRDDNI